MKWNKMQLIGKNGIGWNKNKCNEIKINPMK